jgi:hypothetical protein
MRCAGSLLISSFVLAAVVGCKNQSAPLANPFLTPDRVPPPQTRVLMPGTAQPYYPGDPAPSLTTAPATTLPPTTTTFAPAATTIGAPQPGTIVPGQVVPSNIPGGAYPGAPPVNPVTPVTPVSPPGGWGTYPPSGGTASLSAPSGFQTASTGGEAVRVPGDSGALRFEPPTPAPSLPADAVVPAASQSIAALNPNQPTVAPAPGGAFQPNAGAQGPVEQARFGLPGFQQLAIREVTQAEFQQEMIPTAASPQVVPAASDGFRPAGSSPASDAAGSQSFRTPEIHGGGSVAGSATPSTDARFGVGGSQEWLRGQLEYWPETGEWSIRYMGDGPKDQIGGRVLIDNPQVLGNLPPGEYVVLHGQLFGRQVDDSSYRPTYRVATVERQQK